MNVRAVWQFIAGDSRLAPPAVALAVGAAAFALRAPALAPLAGPLLAVVVALGLSAAVFERR